MAITILFMESVKKKKKKKKWWASDFKENVKKSVLAYMIIYFSKFGIEMVTNPVRFSLVITLVQK